MINREAPHRMLILRLQAWCRRYRVPYAHGCVWDRACRDDGIAGPRIYLHGIAGRVVEIDLPLRYTYWTGSTERHRLSVGWGWTPPINRK